MWSDDDSLSSHGTVECALKCEGAKEFYSFPAKAVKRHEWFQRLKIEAEADDFHPSFWVCNRHFSAKMFTSDKRLKTSAVPDKNLPTGLSYTSEILTNVVSPKQLDPNKSVTPTTGKNTHSNGLKKNSCVLPPKSNILQSNNWINDFSKTLVDYQLKVRGKHVCDVVEVPQYIVVFTVVKPKQRKLIQFKNINKSQRTTKIGLPKELSTSEIITIDDDLEDDLDVIHLEGPAKKTKPPVFNKQIPINQPGETIVQKTTAIVQQNSAIIEPNSAISQLTTTISQLSEITKYTLYNELTPTINQLTSASIGRARLTAIQQKSESKIEPKYQIDIVYYNKKEAYPRRERAVQVEFCETKEIAIQCDVQLENDIIEMTNNGVLYWKDLKNDNKKMHECLFCGEIIINYASKVKHVHGHEEASSLCSQCGIFFENRIKLDTHEKSLHSKKFNSKKLQRCPRRNCYKAFHSKKQLNTHIEKHVKTKNHRCNKCFEFFDSSLKLICHQKALDKCLRVRGWTSRRWSKRI